MTTMPIGFRMLWATATHGPFELVAYAALLQRLVGCARGPLAGRDIARTGLWAALLLAAGALVETFGTLP